MKGKRISGPQGGGEAGTRVGVELRGSWMIY